MSREGLRFREDGTFTVVQFTDVHWKNGEPEDEKTRSLMGEVLDQEKPDLAVLTGDQIFGSECVEPAASWRHAVSPMVERSVPWAAVYGNHDAEGALSRAELMEVQRAIPHCLSEPGPEEVTGVGNYVLPIVAREGERVAAQLYLFDSPDPQAGMPEGWGWIRRDQIGWYLERARMAREGNGGQPAPALAFFHIPLREYQEVWDRGLCEGSKYESVGGPPINTGLFAALLEGGDVCGVFVGHDHVNDYAGDLMGIALCYGRGSGYNTYGRDGFKRGARVIRLREGVHGFETWFRLEGGEAVSCPAMGALVTKE